MTNVIYNRDIPDGPNNPSQDQPKMKTNTNSLDSLISIDHIGFGNNQGGYHKDIHQPFFGTWNPVARTITPPIAPIVGVNQIVPLNYTPDTTGGTVDTQFFNITGGGGVSQLTGNSTSNATDGWVWSGGLLFQWGTVADAALTNGLTFKDRVSGAIPFPSTCFCVVATLTQLPFGSIIIGLTTNQGFAWAKNTASHFRWFAVGI